MADEKVSVEITAVDRAGEVFKNLGRQSDDLARSLTSVLTPTKLLGGVIGFELANALKSSVEAFTKFATQVKELSYLSGGSAREVSVLVNGMEALGVESGTVERGMNMMSRAVEAGSPALARLGVSIRDANGQQKTGIALFYETVDALGKTRNEVERNSLARDIFGRGWMEMIPILAMGSDKVKELGQVTGKILTEDDLKRAKDFKLAVHELTEKWEAFKIAVGGGIVVPITWVIKSLTPSGEGWKPLDGTMEEAARKALPGLYKNIPTTAATYGIYDDPSLHGKGYIASPKSPVEVEKEAKILAQLAKLRAQALGAGAITEPERLEAAIAAIEASRKEQLGGLDAQAAQTKLPKDLEDIKKLRIATNAAADAQIEKARRESQDRLWELATKNNAGFVAAAEEEIRLAEMVSEDKLKVQEELNSANEKQREAEIAGWVAVADAEMEASEEAAKAEAKRYDDLYALKARTLEGTLDALEEETRAVKRAVDKGILTREQGARMLTEIEAKANDARVRDEQRALLEKFNAEQDFFEKVKLGLQLHTGDWRTGYQRISDITKEFARAATRSLDDFYFNVITGRFSSLGDVVKQFGLSLARIASNQLATSTMSALFGGPGGGGVNWWDLGSKAVSGVGSAVSTVGSWLGMLDVGAWKVGAGGGSSASTYAGAWGKSKPAGVAVLHDGEMVVPPDVAEMIRRLVALSGGSDFSGLSSLLTGGGGRGGTGPSQGAYGQMTAAERSTLSSFGGFGNFGTLSTGFGMLSGLLGMGPLGKTAIDAMISGILGFDAVRTSLGIDPNLGWASPTAADYASIQDTYGYGSRQEADTRTAASIGNSLAGDLDAARSGAAAAEAGAAEAANRAAEAQEASQRDAQGFGNGPSGQGPGGSEGADNDSGGHGAAGDGSMNAMGTLFRTRGRTKMTVGEAGSETVAVLRNPREVMAGGGGTIVNVSIDLRGSVTDSQVATHIAREIKKSLDRIESRRISY